jgi:hypothetical protein
VGGSGSLTGGLLQWGSMALAVSAFAAVIVLWPQCGRQRPAQIAGRVGLVLTVNVLVLLAAAAQFNDEFLFFPGWTDLGGALTGTTTAADWHGGGTASQAAAAQVNGPSAAQTALTASGLQALHADVPAPGGAVAYQVTGPLSGITAQVLVALPRRWPCGWKRPTPTPSPTAPAPS